MNENCVVYCRNSDPGKTSDAETFESQEAECREYAAKHSLTVVKVYREAKSGAKLLDREQVWDAVEDIRRGDASVLLVRDLDRLSREPYHMGALQYEIVDKCHGRIESVNDKIDPEDDGAEITRAVTAIVGKMERKKIVRRLANGKVRAAKRGDLAGMPNPLYGYAFESDIPGERTSYIEDADAANTVRLVFRLAISGYSLRAIAKKLNQDGVPTRAQHNASRGHIGRRAVGEVWNAEQVRRIVSERAYLGELDAYRWQRTTAKSSGKVSMMRRAEDDEKRIRISIPVIIDQATFDAANNATKMRETDGRPPIDQEASWLRSHLLCGVCHSRMYVRRTSDGKYAYQCRNRKGRSTSDQYCAGGDFSVRTTELDSTAYVALAEVVSRLDKLRDLMLKKLGSEKIVTLTRISESFQAQLQGKQAELDNARLSARQTSDQELRQMFIQDAESLNRELKAIQADYNEARDQLDNFSSGSAWVDASIARIKASVPVENPTAEDIRALDVEARRFLLEASGCVLYIFPLDPAGGRICYVAFHQDEPAKNTSQSCSGLIHLSISLSELVA